MSSLYYATPINEMTQYNILSASTCLSLFPISPRAYILEVKSATESLILEENIYWFWISGGAFGLCHRLPKPASCEESWGSLQLSQPRYTATWFKKKERDLSIEKYFFHTGFEQVLQICTICTIHGGSICCRIITEKLLLQLHLPPPKTSSSQPFKCLLHLTYRDCKSLLGAWIAAWSIFVICNIGLYQPIWLY